ncbi:MAG: ATP-binding protein (plasmid) [Candidatus Manganitrophus sp.]|nr:ATP-binding protein [Candidatus Manganitrophus sp.]
MIMKASVSGRVRHTNLPKTKTMLPVFEAVMNAFQAVEERGGIGHRITIHAERQLTLDSDKSAPIESFIITDTGIGFTDENYASQPAPYTASYGGKGLGRFLWLNFVVLIALPATTSGC